MKTLSASQVETWAQCQRKWAFKYLEGFDYTAPSAALGTRVHSILEEYQRDGVAPDLAETMVLANPHAKNDDGSPKLVTYYPGQIAQAGLHLLPAPGIVEVEGKFSTTTPGGTKWQGRKDGRYIKAPDGRAIAVDPWVLMTEGYVLRVQDHKTTSNKKYAKTPETLHVDRQSILYAHSEFEEFPNIETVQGEWVYYLTKAAKVKAWTVLQTFTRAHVRERIAMIDEEGQQIQQLYQIRPKALDLPPTPSHCDAYGGCPHRGKCQISILERLDSMTQSLDDFISEKKNAKNGAAMPAPAMPPAPGNGSVHDARPDAPPELVAMLPALHAQGHTIHAIADYYNVNLGSVNRAISPPPAMPAIPAPTTPPGAQKLLDESYARTPAAPTYWKPGDPLNEVQQYIASQGKPLSAIAAGADVIPPDDIRKGYDRTPTPVERGVINPPEAPKFAPASPAEMPAPPAPKASAIIATPDNLDALDRDTLKKYAIQIGAVDQSSRLREEGLKEAIRAKQNGVAGHPGNVVATQPGLPPQATLQVIPPPPKADNTYHMGVQTPVTHAKTVAKIGTLYINCMPVGFAFITLEKLFDEAEVFEKLKIAGLQDFRFADYGKGPGILSASLEEGLPIFTEAVVVDARTAEGAAVLSMLTRNSHDVVRGF